MKKILMSLIFLSFITMSMKSQEQEIEPTMEIDTAITACIHMQEALECKDTTAMRESAKEFLYAFTEEFDSLECMDFSKTSLNGHFVFNDTFVLALLNDSTAYDNANKIERQHYIELEKLKGRVLLDYYKMPVRTKTCAVKAGKSTKYSFPSKGRQELGIVAEPGGLVAVRIHATNKDGLDEWHNDTKNPKGTRRFKTAFDLPKDKRNTVELEVINKSPKDISFVVISN